MVTATLLTLVAFLTGAPSLLAQGPPPLNRAQRASLRARADFLRAQAGFVGSVGDYLQGRAAGVAAQGAYLQGQAAVVAAHGAYLQGVASVITATGDYHNKIQEARITRERSRQIAIDKQRKEIEFHLWYNTIRPTAPKMMKAEEAADLDWARNHAKKTEIWSGRPLNVLLGSILQAPSPTQGPQVPLSEAVLRGLNLTDGETRANLSLTKDEGQIDWPEALQTESFDEVRDRFSKNFGVASRQVSESVRPSRAQMNSLRADLKSMEELLAEQVRRLVPSRYIESQRLLKQLSATVRGLSSTKLVRSPHADWRKNVKTVSELVAYCQQNGLEFGPAVDGDKAAYTAACVALRSYERGLARPSSAT
jgi:hypothetical protein